MRSQFVRCSLCWLTVAFGCNSPETKLCHEKMTEAQNAVNAVESNSLDSLNRCIQLVELAEASCRLAERDAETKQLAQARERLVGHRALVEERDARKKAKESLSPSQVDRLVREGDPNCPRGQAYQNKASGKEIRCVGIQPVEMGWDQAFKYFGSRNFRRVETADDSTLTLESGSEKFVLSYDKSDRSAAPRCVVIYPRTGVSWQEAVARFTGVAPERLKSVGTVTVGQSKIRLDVDDKNQVVRLGECPR